MRDTLSELARPEVWRFVLEQLPGGVYVLDSDLRIVFWNAGAERITGRLRQDVIGHLTRDDLITRAASTPASDLLHGSPALAALRDGCCSESEAFLHHQDGYRIPIKLRTFAVRDARGLVIGAAESFEENIAHSKWNRRQSKLMAYGCLDSATGVLTREFAESRLRESLTTFYAHPLPFAIFCIFADEMGQVRGKFGPWADHDLLRLIGQTLGQSLRPNDSVGYWEEDEFFVLAAECSRAEVEKVGERLRQMISYARIKWWGEAIRASVSLGGTTVCTGDTLELLLQRAHQAMSVSVNGGGNRLTILEV
jgi:diguanylate cyclase (GGDEF)-like protein/PAS domain S-box-containing protein